LNPKITIISAIFKQLFFKIMLHKNTLQFLHDLNLNNNKPWMDDNRAIYLEAKENFETFTTQIINTLSSKLPYLQSIEAKKCTFRLNRDVRFSKNKAPYKNNMGASIKLDGKKSIYAGFYVHLQPNASFVGGGLYMPDAPLLQKIRQEIDYNCPQFKKIINNKTFVAQYPNGLMQDDALKNIPKGYEATNPAAAFLKLKHFVTTTSYTNKQMLDKDAVKNICTTLMALNPLVEFLNNALQPDA
jgi:uncharacterized protein (TIGR02453 family)